MDFTSGGDEAQRSVPLVRVTTAETLYDKELLLGRDVTSVFPNEAKPDDPNFSEALGAVKFVTEKELATIKAGRGERVEDGTIDAQKSLAQVLADNKQEKEDEFQAKWKQMKVGGNKPLDEEEATFFEELVETQRLQDETKQEEEDDALLSFQVAQAEMAEVVTKVAEPLTVAPELLRPAVPVKRKHTGPLAGMVVVKGSAKKSKVEVPKKVEEIPESPEREDVGLGGLIAYSSSDDGGDDN